MIAGALHFQLDLPYGRPPDALWGNRRGRNAHWGSQSAASKHVRRDVMLLGRTAKIPQSEHLHVVLTWAPGDRRRRDADNMWPFLKACCDGLARGKHTDKHTGANTLIGLDLVPDDTPQYMTKHAPRIMTPDDFPGKGMWLDIWAVPVAVAL